MKYLKLKGSFKKILADTISPVSIYLRLRDLYPETILLESSEYQSRNGAHSYLCFNPLAEINITNRRLKTKIIGESTSEHIDECIDIPATIDNFKDHINIDPLNLDVIHTGLFGYSTFESAQYFDSVKFDNDIACEKNIPTLLYRFYQYVIVFDHFKNEVYITSQTPIEEEVDLSYLAHYISAAPLTDYQFKKQGAEYCNSTPDEFLSMVSKAKHHCARGDVFQLVLSRRFSQRFDGDDFNVYRSLRSINPSPYMFYFDFGSFTLFGSSPEAQIVVEAGQASIHPIAGTYHRTGDLSKDLLLADQLKKDPKENAEHVMLVDLARNDLSIHGDQVKVETFSEIQMYSHVIHLVSKVTARTPDNPITVYTDTFPAGTLSGAPKYKAMELINTYENEQRSFYGGAIGIFGFDQNINHAIMIRTFLSLNNVLTYQAGAGLIIDSDPESELKEVDNKLGALRKALQDAELINQ